MLLEVIILLRFTYHVCWQSLRQSIRKLTVYRMFTLENNPKTQVKIMLVAVTEIYRTLLEYCICFLFSYNLLSKKDIARNFNQIYKILSQSQNFLLIVKLSFGKFLFNVLLP